MSLVLDTHGFDAFISSLVEMSGASRGDVLREQAGALLTICINRSPNPYKKLGKGALRKKVAARVTKPGRYIGDSGTLVSASENRVPRPIPYSTLQTMTGTRGSKAGREWYIGQNRRGKRIFLSADKMLGNEKFHRRQGIKFALYEILEPKVESAMSHIGSLAASWVSIADTVNAPLRRAPAWVKKVRRTIEDGARSSLQITNTAQFIELVNTNSLLISRYNGAAIMQGAIETRLKAFSNDMRRGVFDDIATRAKRYPGIFVVP